MAKTWKSLIIQSPTCFGHYPYKVGSICSILWITETGAPYVWQLIWGNCTFHEAWDHSIPFYTWLKTLKPNSTWCLSKSIQLEDNQVFKRLNSVIHIFSNFIYPNQMGIFLGQLGWGKRGFLLWPSIVCFFLLWPTTFLVLVSEFLCVSYSDIYMS